ncbi:MAG: hypothetical protein AAFU77_10355 [Myxococcota bacterium]
MKQCQHPGSCPSDFVLDRYHGDELAGAERREVQARIGGCERCVERMDERTRGFAAFEGLDPGAVWERVEEQGKVIAFPRRAAWVGGGLVAAAAALLFVVSPPGATDGVRLKGGATLRLHRQVEGGSEVLSSGASARPGDRVRFEVGLPAAGVVAIYGVEASGDRYTARPAEFLDAGTGQLLEGAVALDPSLGAEVLYLVRCDERSAVGACEITADSITCADRCDTARFELEKRR